MSFVTAWTAISAQHLTVCNAIRSAEKNTALMIDLFGGGNPGSLGTNGGLTVRNLCHCDQRHLTPLFPRLVRKVFRGPAGAQKYSRHRGLAGGAERQCRQDHSGAFQRVWQLAEWLQRGSGRRRDRGRGHPPRRELRSSACGQLSIWSHS